jgi:site-specific recombinase XerC
MGRVLQRTSKKPLPSNATISVDAKGRRIAEWVIRGKKFKYPVTTDGEHYEFKSRHWTVIYRPHCGGPEIRERTHYTDKSCAEKLLREREKQEEDKRLGLYDEARDRAHKALNQPISLHIEDYLVNLRNDGRTEKHIQIIGSRLKRLMQSGRIETLAQLHLSSAKHALASLAEKSGWAEQTRNHFVVTLKSFTNWLCDDDRLERNPIKKLKEKPVQERRRQRRLLGSQEFDYLQQGAQLRTRPNQKVSGPDRLKFYRIAAFTGYRLNEIGSLTPESFKEDASGVLMVSLPATKTKNRKPDDRPVPETERAWLAEWLATRPARERLFNLPHKFCKLLRRDMAAGRELWINEARSDEERRAREASDFLLPKTSDGFVFDNHAFRTWYCTEAQRTGASTKTLLDAQRHSDLKVGSRHYWRSELNELVDLQNKVGASLPPMLNPKASESRASGSPDAISRQPGQCAVQCAATEANTGTPGHSEARAENEDSRNPSGNTRIKGNRDSRNSLSPATGPFLFCRP